MAEVQINLLERVRNGTEHYMIKAIIRNVFNERHQQVRTKPKVFTDDEVFELSLIFQRLLQLNLINAASVLECEISKNLYTEDDLKEIVINYSNEYPLSSVYEMKKRHKLPPTAAKPSIEKKPMLPVSTPKDLRIFREKTNEEMVESRKLLHSRKPFREDDDDEEEEGEEEGEEEEEKEEDMDDDEEDDEHTNDDKEVTDAEENDGYDGNSHVISSQVSDDTITPSSSSEEEINTNWTKTLLSSPQKPRKMMESKPSKEALPTFPSLSLQRLPPIIRPSTNNLATNDESPTSTDSEELSDKKKQSILERQSVDSTQRTTEQEVEDISGELVELNFDDLPGDFSDSAESISF